MGETCCWVRAAVFRFRRPCSLSGSPPTNGSRRSFTGEIGLAFLEEASRISSACRYSNAAIAKPVWKVFLAPPPILGGRVECSEGGVVKDRLMGVNKRIFHALPEGSAGRRIKLCSPLSRNGCIPGWGMGFTGVIVVSLHGMPPVYDPIDRFSEPSSSGTRGAAM